MALPSGGNWGWGHNDIDIDVDRYNNFNRNTNVNATYKRNDGANWNTTRSTARA